VLLNLLFMVSVLTLVGQTPTTFIYQAVLRDVDGYINADANVNAEIATGAVRSILEQCGLP